jgi:hypothetical protein
MRTTVSACGREIRVRWWDSAVDAAKHVERLTALDVASKFDGSHQSLWSGLVSGRDDLTQLARKLFDKVDTAIEGRERDTWSPSIMGAYPVVPEALAGMPDCMRRRMPVEDDRAPVRMFLSMLVSSGVSESAMAKRGAALAALAYKMSAERPVELYAVYDMKVNGQGEGRSTVDIVRIPSSPIDEQTVAFLCGAKESSRRLGFALGSDNAGATSTMGSIHWLGGSQPAEPDYMTMLRAAVSATEHDIVLPGGHVTEQDEMLIDPVGWIDKRIAHQRTLQEAA